MIKIYNINIILFIVLLVLSCRFLKSQKDFSCIIVYNLDSNIGQQYYAFVEEDADSIILLLRTLSLVFHELDSATIHIKPKKLRTLAATRPKLNFIFRKKENRVYHIFISNNNKYFADSLYTYMSCLAFSGLMAHELSHIVEYEKHSAIGLLGFAVKYLFTKKKVESETDMFAVGKGFEKELILFKKYIRNSPYTHEKYLRNKQKNYLSVKEIKEISDDDYF